MQRPPAHSPMNPDGFTRTWLLVGHQGNVVDLWERLAADAAAAASSQGPAPLVPELGSDQTSCHLPFGGGYYPAGLSYAEANALMASDPAAFKNKVQDSLRRQVKSAQAAARPAAVAAAAGHGDESPKQRRCRRHKPPPPPPHQGPCPLFPLGSL